MGEHSPTRRPARIRTGADLSALISDLDDLAILVLLVEADPLGVTPLTGVYLSRTGFLLDRRKLIIRTLSHLAVSARDRDQAISLEEWVEDGTEVAARALMDEDAAAERANAVVEEPMEPRYLRLISILGLEPVYIRRACLIVNGLPPKDRLALHHCLFQRKGFGRYANEIGDTPQEVRAAFIRAVTAISTADDHGRDGKKGKGGGDE